jgi:plasmid stability protein
MMNVRIDLTPEEEARLRAAAARNGVSTEECARKVLTDHLPPDESIDRTLKLFAQWEAEDATDDPDEIRRAEEELAELKAGLNAPRATAGSRLLFP